MALPPPLLHQGLSGNTSWEDSQEKLATRSWPLSRLLGSAPPWLRRGERLGAGGWLTHINGYPEAPLRPSTQHQVLAKLLWPLYEAQAEARHHTSDTLEGAVLHARP